MPSKTRWALNPRKWFGAKLNATHKHDKNNHLLTRAPPTAATTTRTAPRLSSGKNKINVISISSSNDFNQNNTPITQLQLPAFSVRREKTLTLLSSSTAFHRQNAFHPTRTQPTIRKHGRLEEELSIDTTRWNVPSITTSISETVKHEHSPIKQVGMNISNMSNRCLVDYPRHLPNRIEECSLPSRSSSSSINDDNDNSSSSGIYTDEHHRPESKETLSTLEVLSVESLTDSQLSLNHSHPRPIIHHYRRPMSAFQTIDDKPQQRQASLIQSHRSYSAEGMINDNQILSARKSRQSSAAIVKKIEKRFPTNRSPSATLEKAGFIRIANDTYRLTFNKTNHLSHSHQNPIDSFEPYSNSDDFLRSANDEECYATLPRTTSTEQLNNNIQNDLRIIVDECIRPMVTSIGKTRLTKPQYHPRYKRSHVQSQLNIENLTNKLLSSIDDSIYARYQRCF